MSYQDDDVVIIDCARTPIARSKNGVFRHVRAEDLSADVINALFARNPAIDPAFSQLAEAESVVIKPRGEGKFDIVGRITVDRWALRAK